MRETKKHMDAFEEYVRLGDERSHAKLAKIVNASKSSVGKWAASFNWIERVKLRDIANAKQIAKITDRSIVATKANYRKDIEDTMKIVKATILSAVNMTTKKLNVSTKTPSDINQLTSAYEKLAKLDLLLIGEDTEKGTVVIQVDVE